MWQKKMQSSQFRWKFALQDMYDRFAIKTTAQNAPLESGI